MALIDCPSCNKKISDKTDLCNHCNFAVGDASEEDIARKRNLQKYMQSQKIQTQSMIAMLMFVSGFGFMYWGGAEPRDLQYNIAVGVALIGFVWYIVNRVRLVFLKKSN
ncbi:hypothetical protein [Paraglaciecola sp. L1A13]|jgi:hypothetical protein|uniref:hypothetical protein n=1 Tax=Paraglaciecola sp. L1A13 TaxID=2686359 RepID=UPI00131A93E2|nr:hypothetical protein [Paraglaciecola sp. L1A13]|tara:strand:- start:18869 stop:19195 length:327 start_codon:yes stop_codon:yes gene_type:complete